MVRVLGVPAAGAEGGAGRVLPRPLLAAAFQFDLRSEEAAPGVLAPDSCAGGGVGRRVAGFLLADAEDGYCLACTAVTIRRTHINQSLNITDEHEGSNSALG